MPTVLELVTEVRDIIDEPTAAQWTDAMLKRWIDEGARDIARTTHHYRSTAIVVLTAGVAEYIVATDVLNIEHAYYDDGTDLRQPLIAKHWEQMDGIWGNRQGWEGAWPQYFATWGHQPNLKVRLYPVPSVTGHELHLLYVCTPVSIVGLADGAQVDVPGAWYDALADYAAYKAMLRDNPAKMQGYLSSYNGKRDQLMHNNEYINVAREMIPDPMALGGMVPRWLADPYY